MSTILNHLAKVAKALVAAATPGVVVINDVTAELSVQSTTLVAVVITAVLTWLTPNKAA